MITLKELKKALYKDLPFIRNKDFLTVFFPEPLYYNKNDQFNIDFKDASYQKIAPCLSHLMNGKISDKTDKTTTKNGTERIRNQMLSIIRDNDDIFHAIEINCKNFIENNCIDKNIFNELIETLDNDMSWLKKHFYHCLELCPSHGLTLLLLYALLPNHVNALTHLKNWEKSSLPASLSHKQKDNVISLQQDLSKLINILKESYGTVKENDNSYLNQKTTFEASLEYHRLELPSDIRQDFSNLLKAANDIYFHLYKSPAPPYDYPTIFGCQLEKLIQLENNYISFCQKLAERISE